MKVLITGRSGTGKSTICRELQRQGYTSIDTDHVDGLSGWFDTKTRQLVQVDYGKPIDRLAIHWNWDKTIFNGLLATSDDLFLCGSADNQFDFHSLFDKIFVLTLPPEIQRQRIINRTEHAYGKLPAMQERILLEQQEFVQEVLARGAIAIDAVPKPSEIVQTIVRLLREQ
jgi:broad-specificity NMP kinase